jgi:hypothetical protein
LKFAATIVGVIYLQGLILNLIFGSFSWLGGASAPGPWWWYVSGGALVTGLAAIILEGIGLFFGKGFTFQDGASQFRKSAGFAALILIVIAVVIGGPIYHISQQ